MTAWIPFGTPSTGQLRLLCLPHAGAGALTYRTWGAGLAPQVDVWPVQPPGREHRVSQTPYDRLDPLVTDLARELIAVLEPPYAVFGHSVGAIVAFELVRQLQRLGGPAPVHLFVAGRHAPQQPYHLPRMHDAPIEDLAREIGSLGGTPATFLADPDFLADMAPLLRADFAVNETYGYRPGPPLAVPITAFAATADPRAGRAHLAAWAEQTTAGFALRPIPGDHFAVINQARFVHGRIREVTASAQFLQRV